MQCKQIKNNKARCGGQATRDGFCYFHSPSVPEKQKRESRVLGGQAKSHRISNPLPTIHVESTEQLLELLNTTVQEVRRGKIDCRVANTIGFLSGHMLRAFEISEIETRLATLENQLVNSKAR